MDDFEKEPTPPGNGFKMILIAALVLIGLTAIYLVVGRGAREQSRTAVEQLQFELDNERAAMNGQRDRLVQISREVDSLKQSIETGQAANLKQAKQDYTRYAKEQRTAREDYLTMEAAYNGKAATFQKLKAEEEE